MDLLEEETFSLIARKIKEAGTDDPREVADYYDFLWVDLQGSVKGYAALYNDSIPALGLHVLLEGNWYMFGGWHELTHIFRGDIYESGFTNGHADTGFFTQEVSSLNIPKHERIANLVAADVTVKDKAVEEVTNYNSPTLRSYRRMKAYQMGLAKEMESLRSSFNPSSNYLKVQMNDLKRKINGVRETLRNMEDEMISCNYNKTFSEMAMDLGISERILRYKLEAMRLKGADIDPQELERYDRMFDNVI